MASTPCPHCPVTDRRASTSSSCALFVFGKCKCAHQVHGVRGVVGAIDYFYKPRDQWKWTNQRVCNWEVKTFDDVGFIADGNFHQWPGYKSLVKDLARNGVPDRPALMTDDAYLQLVLDVGFEVVEQNLERAWSFVARAIRVE